MPDDSTTLRYFDEFFKHVHPHMPVLSKTLFYRQWHSDRHSVSPLILEALFAIGSRILDEPAQARQWLDFASGKIRFQQQRILLSRIIFRNCLLTCSSKRTQTRLWIHHVSAPCRRSS